MMILHWGYPIETLPRYVEYKISLNITLQPIGKIL